MPKGFVAGECQRVHRREQAAAKWIIRPWAVASLGQKAPKIKQAADRLLQGSS
jgi:hypothetical protein